MPPHARGEGPIPDARYRWSVAVASECWFLLIAAACFAGGGDAGLSAVDSRCELPRGVPALWSVVLVVSAVLSPAAVFVQPVPTYLRHARRGTSAYKLRQTFYQLPSTAKPNHVTHAKVYGLGCGVGQVAYCAMCLTYAVAIFSEASCGSLRARAMLVLLSAVSLFPFIMYKCCAPGGCPGWSAAYDSWGAKFAVDTAGRNAYGAKVEPEAGSKNDTSLGNTTTTNATTSTVDG